MSIFLGKSLLHQEVKLIKNRDLKTKCLVPLFPFMILLFAFLEVVPNALESIIILYYTCFTFIASMFRPINPLFS